MPQLPVHYESNAGEFEIIAQNAFRLHRLEDPNYPDKPTILSPDCGIVFKDRFLNETISIDFNKDPSEIRIYSFNPDTNIVVYQKEKDPVEVRSQVLKGLVLDMQDIRMSEE
ncbi:hypothetical protein F8M41_012557 [Gigaspora margarita]|uniref:Uncharacterized protein n=1 Tax=Gigaspora margarita TaxID=4874 RepID=A0A8H3X0Y2_GIGMA|nr:hypothetical protein F8M41_012557 [Gigaspora margarita]